MSEQRYIRGLSAIVLFLVSTVTVISFALSYEALWNFALVGGKPWYLSWLWPVIIDLPIVVFSTVALFAVVLGFNPWPFRGLVLAATVGTVWFNYSYALTKGLSWEVYITAPIMYFVSFEVLVWLIKIVSERSVLVTKIAEISAKLGVLELEYKGKKDNLTAELERLQHERLAEIEAMGQRLQLEKDSQLSQLDKWIEEARLTLANYQEQLEPMERTIQTYRQDIEAKKEELKALGIDQAKVFVPANLDISQRRELVNRMSQEGMTIEAIAGALGCSVGTVKNDKAANKQIVSPVEIPGTIARNGNGHAGKV